RVSVLAKYFAGLAVLISCLGLFGLASFMVDRRIKEISIRKMLGASVWRIVFLLSAEFTKMIGIAILISLPISYLVAYRWLEEFVYKIELKWWLFAGAAMVALLIAWVTVGVQTLKAASTNPINGLRRE
ncbi:MAG: FtsX-like permease family protein, partial [Bacteroidota bacterium]